MPLRKPLGGFFIRPTGESDWFMLLSLKREIDRDAEHIRKHRPNYWVGDAAPSIPTLGIVRRQPRARLTGNRPICNAGCAHGRPADERMVDLATMIHKVHP